MCFADFGLEYTKTYVLGFEVIGGNLREYSSP